MSSPRTPEARARRAAYMRRWRAENAEAWRFTKAKWREGHREQIREADRRRYAARRARA